MMLHGIRKYNLPLNKAFKTMFLFLNKKYQKNKTEDIAQILSDINLLRWQSRNLAAKYDWLESTEKIRAKGISNKSKLTKDEAFRAMVDFLRKFGERITSADVFSLLISLKTQ